MGRTHGCDGCVWTLVVHCDRNTIQDPAYTNCNAARCPDGQLQQLYLQTSPTADPRYVDTICVSSTRRIVTAAELSVDAERYVKDLRPPPGTIGVQPDGRALTGKPTFFIANGPATDSATIEAATAAGPATLRIDIAPTTYAWEFGDGATCETTEPGGPYDGPPARERCDDRVAHVYDQAGTTTVRLRTTWSGTYTFDVGFGPVGPLPIQGNGVTAPEAVRSVAVREAHAELVGH